MLSYPASIPLSNRSLNQLAELIRVHRRQRRSRWRRLDPGQQALITVAHLRNGDTYARLATGFQVGLSTIYRYLREAIDLLASRAIPLDRAVYQAARLIYVILDGTLIPIDRVAADRPYYSAKHKRHGVNVRVLADTRGRLLWA
jgi:Helix-turn-helix of DDE superfamily endonuclease